MDLKDFIQTAVTQIVEGVVAAQAAAAAHRVVVNPAVEPAARNVAAAIPAMAASRMSNIAFDIVVTGTEGSTAHGSGRLLVAGASSVLAGNERHAAGEHLTRLQFSLPIAFPEARVKRPMANALDSEFLQSVDNGDSTWLPS
jgi:hypothetical protein